jgi:hypothetical protein
MGGFPFMIGALQRRRPGNYQPMEKRPFGDEIWVFSQETPKPKRRAIRQPEIGINGGAHFSGSCAIGEKAEGNSTAKMHRKSPLRAPGRERCEAGLATDVRFSEETHSAKGLALIQP